MAHPRGVETSNVKRCAWARDEISIAYHDNEWGVPLHDDRGLFELFILEGAQAGLSWITILKKRAAYRRAFDRFDPRKVARYDEAKIAALLANDGIVRNRLKIRAAVQNARAFLAVQKEFGELRSIHLAVHWRCFDSESLAANGSVAEPYRTVGWDQQGSCEARVQVCRFYDLLRLHAGYRHGERSPGNLLSL